MLMSYYKKSIMSQTEYDDLRAESRVKSNKQFPWRRFVRPLIGVCLAGFVVSRFVYSLSKQTIPELRIPVGMTTTTQTTEQRRSQICEDGEKVTNGGQSICLYPNDTSVLYGLPLPSIRRRAVKGSPLDYLASYKNPCWFEDVTSEAGIRCLPYFYVIGVTKSGTSTFYKNLLFHADVTKGQQKEMYWWGRVKLRFTFRSYINHFQKSAKEIYHAQNDIGNLKDFHQKITVDATPSYFSRQGDLSVLPGNRGLPEPRYTLAHTLYRLFPNTHLLVILRHPTDRLYSHYHHVFGGRRSFSPEAFHENVIDSMEMMEACLKEHSLKSCVFNHSLFSSITRKGLMPLSYSMYYPFAKAWLEVFPRKQILFIKSEDFFANTSLVMTTVYSFLGLDPSRTIRGDDEHAKYKTEYRTTMLTKTRDMLDSYFRPLNNKLADLLRDERFRFERR